jgi:hypothetical protein
VVTPEETAIGHRDAGIGERYDLAIDPAIAGMGPEANADS